MKRKGDAALLTRRADAFFYGLFMDVDLLRDKELDPRDVERGWVDGVRLRIGTSAALEPDAAARTHGVVISLTLDDLGRLYSDPRVAGYRPEAVLVQLEGGGVTAALCFNLAASSVGPLSPDYATKLRTVARKVGLPADSIDAI